MKSNRSNEEKAFREGMQDNTVKLSDDLDDPKSPVTNQDLQVTNEDGQNLVTGEVDDHGIESKREEENPAPDPKKTEIDSPEADNSIDQPGNTEPGAEKKPGYL